MSVEPHAEPTYSQCSLNELLWIDGSKRAYACWYPQMGGYCGRAVAIFDTEDSCIDMLVWHDGEFPFCEGECPVAIHHCDAQQFIEFGQFLKETLYRIQP